MGLIFHFKKTKANVTFKLASLQCNEYNYMEEKDEKISQFIEKRTRYVGIWKKRLRLLTSHYPCKINKATGSKLNVTLHSGKWDELCKNRCFGQWVLTSEKNK